MAISFRTVLLAGVALGLMSGCGYEWRRSKKDSSQTTQPEPSLPPAHNQGPTPFAESAYTGRPVLNLTELTTALQLESYRNQGHVGQGVTVAVLDNGFSGLATARGVTLPGDITVQNTNEGDPSDTLHGTKLAEIVWAVATGKGFYNRQSPGPTLRLYVTNGPFKNLERAVDDLIRYKRTRPRQPVIALYSQIWESAGNLDGQGYINGLVNRAIQAGIIWVNAAGNLGESSYKGPLKVDSANNVVLPLHGRYLRFEVKNAGTPVKITLGWSDFKDTYYFHRTAIDLNLILEDDHGNEMGRGKLVQDGVYHGKTEGYSRHPREGLSVTLPKGFYRLRAEAASGTAALIKFKKFDVWAAVNGSDVVMEGSNGHSFVFPPADNPQVITIGASDVPYGNGATDEALGILKPDFLTPSRITFADGMTIHGTSTAAAVAAGAIAVAMEAKSLKTRAEILASLGSPQEVPESSGVNAPKTPGLHETTTKTCTGKDCPTPVQWQAPLMVLPAQ